MRGVELSYSAKAIAMLRFWSLSLVALGGVVFMHAGTRGPLPIDQPKPTLEGDLKESSGELTLKGSINKKGRVAESEVTRSTNPSLNDPIASTFDKWTFRPAQKDRKPIQAVVFQHVSVEKGEVTYEPTLPANRPPIAKKTVRPEPGKEIAYLSGNLRIQAIVTAEGKVEDIHVIDSDQAQLNQCVSEALSQWVFKPALSNGQAIARKIIVPFSITGSGPHPKPIKTPKTLITRAKPIQRSKPELPENLLEKKGHSELLLSIDSTGNVVQVEVIDSTHNELTRLAAKTALSWKFKPAQKEGQPMASKVLQNFYFNGGKKDANNEAFQLPTIEDLPLPKLPDYLTGQKGYVNLELNLDEKGYVLNATSTDSSSPELVSISIEASRNWKFTPAINQGQAVATTITLPIKFGDS